MIEYERWAIRLNLHSIRLVDRLRSIKPIWFLRPMLRFVKDNYNYPLTGLEIGVSYGYNAEVMLKCLNLKILFLIDPIPLCQDRIKKFPNAIYSPFRSEDIYRHIPDNLDFIYIDGDHSYEGVKKDIELYWPKVRKGGVFGGHDFCPKIHGVARAVTEFTVKNRLDLQGDQFDWWVVK